MFGAVKKVGIRDDGDVDDVKYFSIDHNNCCNCATIHLKRRVAKIGPRCSGLNQKAPLLSPNFLAQQLPVAKTEQ